MRRNYYMVAIDKDLDVWRQKQSLHLSEFLNHSLRERMDADNGLKGLVKDLKNVP